MKVYVALKNWDSVKQRKKKKYAKNVKIKKKISEIVYKKKLSSILQYKIEHYLFIYMSLEQMR